MHRPTINGILNQAKSIPKAIKNIIWTPENIEYDETNGFNLSTYDLPEEIVSYMLSFLNFTTLLNCRLVCKSWKYMVEKTSLKIKVERLKTKSLEGLNQRRLYKLPWHVYYIVGRKDPFNKNILENGCGQDGLFRWSIVLNGGDKWKIEDEPNGADPLPEHEDFESNLSCFATSYSECRKQQIIPLLSNGFTKKILDEIQPDIEVSEWFSGRFDCGCRYDWFVSILNEQKKPLNEKLSHFETQDIKQWEGKAWKKVSHVFKEYGVGARYILFMHGGHDLQFWAGHYGSKMSGARVVVKIPELKQEKLEKIQKAQDEDGGAANSSSESECSSAEDVLDTPNVLFATNMIV